MSRRERLAAAIDRLADVIPGGHLMAATDPAELLTQAADAITATARGVEAAMEWRAAWFERGATDDMARGLAALLTAARAEGAAEAIEAAARVADTQAKHNLDMGRDNPPDKEWCLDRALTAQVIRDAIRTASPAGLVAVSVDDLWHALGTCGCKQRDVAEMQDGHRTFLRVWPEAHTAAIARLEARIK